MYDPTFQSSTTTLLRTVKATAPAGFQSTGTSGAYDPKDNLVLLATSAGINILDTDTLQFKNNLYIAGEGDVAFGDTAHAVIGGYCDFGLIQFDPVTLATSGSVPCGSQSDPINIGQNALQARLCNPLQRLR